MVLCSSPVTKCLVEKGFVGIKKGKKNQLLLLLCSVKVLEGKKAYVCAIKMNLDGV